MLWSFVVYCLFVLLSFCSCLSHAIRARCIIFYQLEFYQKFVIKTIDKKNYIIWRKKKNSKKLCKNNEKRKASRSRAFQSKCLNVQCFDKGKTKDYFQITSWWNPRIMLKSMALPSTSLSLRNPYLRKITIFIFITQLPRVEAVRGCLER